jgi:hypothetical protein
VKSYIISRSSDGTLRLICQSLVRGKLVETFPAGPFEIGDFSKETHALALAILLHYYGSDAGGQAEAQRKAEAFLGAFLLTHTLPLGGSYEITSDVVDRWAFLWQIPVAAK